MATALDKTMAASAVTTESPTRISDLSWRGSRGFPLENGQGRPWGTEAVGPPDSRCGASELRRSSRRDRLQARAVEHGVEQQRHGAAPEEAEGGVLGEDDDLALAVRLGGHEERAGEHLLGFG